MRGYQRKGPQQPRGKEFTARLLRARAAVRDQPSMTLLIIWTSSLSEASPTFWPRGLSPPLNTRTRGMLATAYLVATSGLSSMFSLPTLTLPANWLAILSMVGPSARHGPHQGAQKSTTTGTSLWATSFS